VFLAQKKNLNPSEIKNEKKTFKGNKALIRLQDPKTEFKLQKQYGHVIYPSIRNFIWNKDKDTFRDKIAFKAQKFWLNIQYDHVIYLSIGDFMEMKKKYI
jgi:hypothetical protein